MRGRRILAVLGAAAATAGTVSAGAAPSTASGSGWTSTGNAALAYTPAAGGWSNQTLRMVVRTSLGGTQLRLHLSNRYAPTATALGHVTVGVQQNGANAAGVPVTVTFGGAQSLTLAAGASAVSDPVALPVAANSRLLVSLFVPAGANAVPPRHDLAGETGFNYNGGDATAASAFPVSNTFSFVTLLDGVDVAAATPSTVVAIGDSITDGLTLPGDTDTRWPNYLAARAAASGLAVTDQGISGDDVTYDQAAAPGVATRWPVDALGQPGVRTVIEQGGINDLRTGVPVTTLESAQQQLIASAHAAGVRVVLATLTPMAGSSGDSATEESARSAYNAWVLGGASGADAVVDFAAAIDNGSGGIAAMYDSGDHLHPNPAGAAALANAIDVTKL